MTQAVILAGGKSTRLASVSGGLPKPLVPVAGIPIIERQIQLCSRYGVDEVFITTGYKAELIVERLGDGSRLETRIHHIREDEPLGTAGGVAALHGRLHEDFLVLYGDVLVFMDLERLLTFHRDKAAIATLVVHPNDHPYDSDLVSVDSEGRVHAFHPNPRPADGPDLPNMVSAALYVLSPEALGYIELNRGQDFVRDVFPKMLADGAALYAYHTTEYLKDMGTPDRLKRVETHLKSGLVEAMHADCERPMAFLDRDGVINEEIDGVHDPEQLRLVPNSAAAVRRLNGAGWLVAGVTNQPAIAKGFMAEQDLEKVHRRLERLLGEAGAWLDDLEHCPHHPEKGHPGERPELKVECDCRKPSAGMLERIVARRTVDLRRSVIIGDSWRDMVAGHAMGLDAIGVMTGHALRHSPPSEFWTSGRPDVVVEDLSQAVSLLLDEDPAIAAILERVDACASSSSPLCILIGGLARSGKSTTAFRLRRALRERGSEALCVRLDDWLLPASERPEGSVLLQRYRVDELTRDLCQLAAGEPVLAPGYDARTRESAPLPVSYDPAGVDVVIAEGVPATLLDLRRAGVLWVQVEAPDEEERRNRLLRFYRFKGFSEEETERMLAAREEEHATVSQAGEGADLRITPSSLRSDSIGDAS